MEQDKKEKQIKHLQKLIFEVDKRNERNKLKRNLIMIMVFSIIIFIGFMYFDTQESIIDYIGDFIASIFLGGLYLFINIIIFHTYFEANNSENKYLDSLKEELQKLYHQ